MTVGGTSPDGATEMCRRYGVTLVAVLADDGERSSLVARVQDHSGQHLVLKRTTLQRRASEIAALRSWNETSCASRLVAVLEDDLYLAEWLSGPSLAAVSDWENCDIVHRNLTHRQTEFVANLQPLADRLLSASDPTTFLSQYCS